MRLKSIRFYVHWNHQLSVFWRPLSRKNKQIPRNTTFIDFSLYALSAIERMKDWMKDTVWEQMMKDKRYCTPYSLLMWASECWVNVVIVCNLKRPSDHQHSSRDRESGGPSLTEGEPHSETEETSYFPKYLHISSRNLSVIMFWKH